MRLDRYLAEGLGITRSQAKDLLSHGRVRIGNTVCKKGDVQVDETSEVFVGGEPLAGAQKFVYIMLNKPQGVVSAREDKRDVTVTDLVAEDFPRRELFPAGRLDKSSTGFVLLTDDGALAHDLLSPRHHVPKTYAVLLDTPLTEEMQKGFEASPLPTARPCARRACRQRLRAFRCARHWPPGWRGPKAGSRFAHRTRALPLWSCGRACITRSSGCSVCTARG